MRKMATITIYMKKGKNKKICLCNNERTRTVNQYVQYVLEVRTHITAYVRTVRIFKFIFLLHYFSTHYIIPYHIITNVI